MGNERIFKHSFGVYFDKGDEHILLKFIEEVTKLGWTKAVSYAEKQNTHRLYFNSQYKNIGENELKINHFWHCHAFNDGTKFFNISVESEYILALQHANERFVKPIIL